VVTILFTIGLRFDGYSTGVGLLIKCHYGHSDETRAADPLTAVTLTYLFIKAAMQQLGRNVGGRMVVSRSNRSCNHRLSIHGVQQANDTTA